VDPSLIEKGFLVLKGVMKWGQKNKRNPVRQHQIPFFGGHTKKYKPNLYCNNIGCVSSTFYFIQKEEMSGR